MKNTKPIWFLNWYRPPNSRIDLFKRYEDFLDFANNNCNCPFVIMGDTNCDIINKPFEGSTKTYNQIYNRYCLKHLNDSLHMRITNRSRTLVEHMLGLTNNLDKVNPMV